VAANTAELVEALLMGSPDAVLVVGPSGEILLASPAVERVFGYTPDQLVGRSVDVLLPPELRGAHEEHRRWFMEQPSARTMGSGLALSARRSDGTTIPVDISLAPVVVQGSPLVGAFVRDVTERRRNEEILAFVNDIARDLLSGSPTADTLTLTARRAAQLATASAAWVVVPDRHALVVAAAHGEGAETMVGAKLSAQSLSAQTITEGLPVPVPDMAADPAVIPEARSMGLGPGLFLPMLGDDETVGALVVARPAGAGPFEPSLVGSLAVFASAAAIVLSLGDARNELEQLREVAEHERIARDLHDTVIQRLFAVGMSLQALRQLSKGAINERLGQTIEAVDQVIREIRETIFVLGRRHTGGPDVRQRLRSVVKEAAEQLGFEPRVGFRGPVEAAVTDDLVTDLLAVAREALSNVARHAKAGRVDVVLEASGSGLVLSVTDDGVGPPRAPSAGHGLTNMESRAKLLGGDLRVSAGSTAGTVVEWSVPLSAD
jgi:PAS domain S-box-containing protein